MRFPIILLSFILTGCYGPGLSRAAGNAISKSVRTGSLNPVIMERSKATGKMLGRSAGEAFMDPSSYSGGECSESSYNSDPNISFDEIDERIEKLKVQ